MIRTKRIEQTLQLTITGRIHLPLAYELTEALLGVAESCSEYRLDLGAATDISDGGLAVLAMFASCARRRGRNVQLTRISKALARRLATMPTLHRLLAPQDRLLSGTGPLISPTERQLRETWRTRCPSDCAGSKATHDPTAGPLQRRQRMLH